MNQPKSLRIESVDVLRGFAIVAIMLLHHIEHFDFYYFPDNLPDWVKTIDGTIWESLFFLFGGKAYAIFALLFGFTFYVQFTNQKSRGDDFAWRFLWRLLLLMGFGIINSLFYEGDILLIYALLGFVLIPVRNLKNSWVFTIAFLLLIQPYEWFRWLGFQWNPEMATAEPVSNFYFAKVGSYLSGDSFWEVIKGNIVNGKPAVFYWSWENGRFFQTAALFLLGMLLGRKGWFRSSADNQQIWAKIFFISAIFFVFIFFSKDTIAYWSASDAARNKLSMILTSYSNFAFMFVWVSAISWLYMKGFFHAFFGFFKPFGKMSLTNYIMQSVFGTFIYYGFGIGLYKYTGALYCFFIAIVIILIQWLFCRWWLKNHDQGPLEHLWHKATWISIKSKK